MLGKIEEKEVEEKEVGTGRKKSRIKGVEVAGVGKERTAPIPTNFPHLGKKCIKTHPFLMELSCIFLVS